MGSHNFPQKWDIAMNLKYLQLLTITYIHLHLHHFDMRGEIIV